MKVAVVGGGSTYTPELADGFARLRSILPIDELALAAGVALTLAAAGHAKADILAGSIWPNGNLETPGAAL